MTASQTDNDTDSSASGRGRTGRLFKLLAAAVLIGIAAIWVGFWLHHRLTHVSENDARVATHEITVSSRLAGRVTGFDLIRGDRLATGARVAQLYSRPDALRRRQLAARVERMQAELDAQAGRIDLARRQISGGIEQMKDVLAADVAAEKAAAADATRARHDAERSAELYQRHGVSEAERDADRYAYQAARAEHDRAERQVRVDRIALDNARTGLLSAPQATIDNPEVLTDERAVMKHRLAEAKAELAHQRTRLDDLAITAPIDGVVDETFIEAGEYVSAGQPIVMMHDPADVWIEAKMKETKIAELAVGQPVAVHVDARPDIAYRGHVAVIGHAATNQFALLPNPNPSGNFTKITQRIPVRIAIDHGPKTALSPGMMVEVAVDTTVTPAASDGRGPAGGNRAARAQPPASAS
ncbi:secretion protein HlyD [Salinisphaera orenii MK-B5]|uniref:Secretion protein HlyD n=1 Tax=Salinisphaera orenii MK-B5 TaxID=856730 RepID=A0A423PN38_9GAMM|nr:HlyD family secretion protein [Salinisphaera orenii]ROO27035.1 secretion protein HlyD [Salinisphaera orenii MK-B5]